MLIYLFVIPIAVLYVALIVIFTVGWRRMPEYKAADCMQPGLHKIAVVVPFHNEAEHIDGLLRSLSRQSYPAFELIFVDDHSTDSTCQLINTYISVFDNCKLISATRRGKKAALKEGIQSADAELIITTDADCEVHPDWVKTIASFYATHETDLIICPVRYKTEKDTNFQRMQQIEFATLVGSGGGAAGAGMPVMCNGANLAFKKNSWMHCMNDLKPGLVSGDDMFLLQAMKKRGYTIRFLKSAQAFVITCPSDSLKSFLKQRTRWSAKSPAYTDGQIIITALAVAGVSFAQLFSLAILLFDFSYWPLTLAVFTVKFLPDLCFFKTIHRFFLLPFTILRFFLLAVFYPFYVSVVILLSLIRSVIEW
ncbi:MAG: glycosyl transferase family 2 [Bacteroidetes bacterium]|nr:glycosyl transferase family 2 [Bacteroidota bacterium]